uniref:trypsin-like peptidase domain-containing protein n=1 Tax=uncultured Dysgonomonas sp. TaxID=206096 RepID=UPI00258EC72B|nr:trypsin-like peptidase domain-containing protein [uncultured Dysgonomonas sp.]
MIDLETIFRNPVTTDQEDFELMPSFVIFKRNPDQTDKYFIIGNGFFINAEGLFVTAGHVFKNEGDFFIGFPENNKNIKLFPVIWKRKFYRNPYDYQEYHDKIKRDSSKYQRGQEYKDVGIGLVKIIKTPFLSLMNKRPKKGQSLRVDGYRRRTNQSTDGVRLINHRIPCEYYIQEQFQYICKQRIGLIRYPCKNDIIFKADKYNYYNNCMLLDGINKAGISGSPVLNKYGTVIGMIIGGDTGEKKTLIILSKYINKISNKLLPSK